MKQIEQEIEKKRTRAKKSRRKVLPKEEKLRLEPCSLSFNNEDSRPILVLKGIESSHTLPVWLNPEEAGSILSQNQSSSMKMQHSVTLKLMEKFDMELIRCEFVEVVGNHQYVHLIFKKGRKEEVLRCRADGAMSLCVSLNIPFYCSEKLANESRVRDVEMKDLEPSVKKSRFRRHRYLM